MDCSGQQKEHHQSYFPTVRTGLQRHVRLQPIIKNDQNPNTAKNLEQNQKNSMLTKSDMIHQATGAAKRGADPTPRPPQPRGRSPRATEGPRPRRPAPPGPRRRRFGGEKTRELRRAPSALDARVRASFFGRVAEFGGWVRAFFGVPVSSTGKQNVFFFLFLRAVVGCFLLEGRRIWRFKDSVLDGKGTTHAEAQGSVAARRPMAEPVCFEAPVLGDCVVKPIWFANCWSVCQTACNWSVT